MMLVVFVPPFVILLHIVLISLLLSVRAQNRQMDLVKQSLAIIIGLELSE